MKPIEFHLDKKNQKTDFKTRYIKFRLGRIKHQLWLNNRKSEHKVLYEEDKKILDKCQNGTTAIFDSAGYYIKDLFPSHNIDVIESNPVVQAFYPDCIICERKDLVNLDKAYDNFIVTNARSDHWVNMDTMGEYFKIYTTVMNKGCRFFYSFRDTQILGFNRLKINMEKFFLDWANNLHQTHGLKLIDHNIMFPKKIKYADSGFNLEENPDTTNGNIKFAFIFE